MKNHDDGSVLPKRAMQSRAVEQLTKKCPCAASGDPHPMASQAEHRIEFRWRPGQTNALRRSTAKQIMHPWPSIALDHECNKHACQSGDNPILENWYFDDGW